MKGAGRTDSGVHALGQVAHFDLERDWDVFRVREAMNYHLRPAPVSILDCVQTDKCFDARFSATRRHYLFRILARRSPPALDINRVWWLPVPLDAEAMHAGAQMLIGKHDFTTFRAALVPGELGAAHAGPVRCVRRGRGDPHQRVRPLVPAQSGALDGRFVEAGRDRALATAADGEALAAKNRAACGPVSPPSGLYLARVDYGATNSLERESDDDEE